MTRCSKINRIFHILFLLTFGWIVFWVFYKLGGQNFLFVLVGAALAAGSFFLYKKLERHAKKNYDKIFWIIFAVMVVLQLMISYLLLCDPVTDLGRVHSFAKGVATTGSFSHTYDLYPSSEGYLARYPNNQAIFLLLCGYYRILFLIFGDIPLFGAVLLNVAALSVSVLFVYKTAKKIFSPAGAFISFLLCLFFLPYYTYTPYFYTDTLSMPFIVVPLFLYVSALKTENKAKKYISLVFAAALIFIGYSLKGSAIILLVGAVVYLFLSVPVKKALTGAGSLLAVFLVCMLAFQSFSASLNFTSKEELYEQQYPLTHWIMMGLSGHGGFSQKDSTFTRNSGNYDQKKAATIEEIGNRLNKMGPNGLLEHLTKKGVWTWSDGTFYIGNHIGNNPHSPNILHKFVLPDGKYNNIFVLVSNGYLLMLLFWVLISALSSAIRPRMNFTVLLNGLIFGVFVFFLVWETRSRYLMNFTPVIILAAAAGIQASARIAGRLKGKRAEQQASRLSQPTTE